MRSGQTVVARAEYRLDAKGTATSSYRHGDAMETGGRDAKIGGLPIDVVRRFPTAGGSPAKSAARRVGGCLLPLRRSRDCVVLDKKAARNGGYAQEQKETIHRDPLPFCLSDSPPVAR